MSDTTGTRGLRFHVHLTNADWDSRFGGWQSAAFRLPGVRVDKVYVDGDEVDSRRWNDKDIGDGLLRWTEPKSVPPAVTATVSLKDNLIEKWKFWWTLAATVIVAIIGAVGTIGGQIAGRKSDECPKCGSGNETQKASSDNNKTLSLSGTISTETNAPFGDARLILANTPCESRSEKSGYFHVARCELPADQLPLMPRLRVEVAKDTWCECQVALDHVNEIHVNTTHLKADDPQCINSHVAAPPGPSPEPPKPSPSSSCSSNMQTDPNNCGACGRVCPGGTCKRGHCTSCTLNVPSETLSEHSPSTSSLTCPHMEWKASATVKYIGTLSPSPKPQNCGDFLAEVTLSAEPNLGDTGPTTYRDRMSYKVDLSKTVSVPRDGAITARLSTGGVNACGNEFPKAVFTGGTYTITSTP